ncbi:hypothetical protein FHS94_002272 [Sphingomonas aerophila]|uniref:Uncharacterized protein n=1 Tax=Sphingomonas aerophila TaxID=1344948 RepID=A0A7W9BE32_9SPHN|nr:hypothetical protein [Sphingomonas aerophila]
MPCQHVSMPGGGTAIVCTSRTRQRCACGRPATLLCDWTVERQRSGTCDKPLCRTCSTSPAPDKDLCAAHATEFTRWAAARAAKPPVEGLLL